MADQATPSKDPANNGLLTGVFRQVLKKFLQRDVDNQLPAKVIAYDRELNIATVEPMIRVLDTNGELTTRAQISEVPVLALGSGSALLNFNLLPGDVGWIEASDRDISTYLNNLAQTGPPTRRMHDFSDGLFIPDKVKGFIIQDSESEITLQTIDGSQRFEVFADKVKMTSGTDSVEIEDGVGITMTSLTKIFLNAPLVDIGDAGPLKDAARVGDPVAGGVIVTGSTTVKVSD
ncbi:MAG: hypothetical protein KAJ19_28065 [Gammaproteobacteria bacterium]|nr:hypothetical protein [Gammaproteobacteria bacterium]